MGPSRNRVLRLPTARRGSTDCEMPPSGSAGRSSVAGVKYTKAWATSSDAAQNQRTWPREAAGRTRKRASEGRDKNRFPRSGGQLTVGPGARRSVCAVRYRSWPSSQRLRTSVRANKYAPRMRSTISPPLTPPPPPPPTCLGSSTATSSALSTAAPRTPPFPRP